MPESVKRLAKQGVTILVQEGVGVEAGFNPSDYEAAGAAIVSDYDELLGEGNIFFKNPGCLSSRWNVRACRSS